jgi:hypothetical protein
MIERAHLLYIFLWSVWFEEYGDIYPLPSPHIIPQKQMLIIIALSIG